MITMTPMYNTMKFNEIFEDLAAFKQAYADSGFPSVITDDSLNVVYYLLEARYSNSPIANFSLPQFKTNLSSIIWQYGPAWEKKLDIQSKIRGLTDTDIENGTAMIHNHAYNPSTEPSTQTLNELEYINDQSVSKVNKGKLEAYRDLWSMISTDVTEEFVDRFKILFKQFVRPHNYVYITEE